MTKKIKFIKMALYLLLLGGIAWQGISVRKLWYNWRYSVRVPFYTVNVYGNLLYPGVYRVPRGTTRFEILKVAGVRPTSDLSVLNLSGQIEEDEQIEVGTLNRSVGLKVEDIRVRLEFFLGEIDVVNQSGASRLQNIGFELNTGDRILTQESSQAELSIGQLSRIYMDNMSELQFDKIDVIENNLRVTEAFHKYGICWFNIEYGSKSEQFRVITPLVKIKVGNNGANFLVENSHNKITIHCFGGLVLVERLESKEAQNVISGQSVTIYDDGRPYQITTIPPDINPDEKFSTLTKEKTTSIAKRIPFNFMFYANPSTYVAISVNFEKSTVTTVSILSNTSVQIFVEGFKTIQEAFLYGGPEFVTTLVERILNIRIPKYCVFEKDDIIRTIAALGSIRMRLDENAAKVLHVRSGWHKLTASEILSFLKPSGSPTTDASRQLMVIKALFENLVSKNIVVTALLADQIIGNIETNLTSFEVINNYERFIGRENWTFREFSLPVETVAEKGRTYFEPVLKDCKAIFNNQ